MLLRGLNQQPENTVTPPPPRFLQISPSQKNSSRTGDTLYRLQLKMSLHCWQTVAPVGLNQLSDSEHQPSPQEQRQALRLIWHSDQTVQLLHTGQEGPFHISLHCEGGCCKTLYRKPRNMFWTPFHLVWSHLERSKRCNAFSCPRSG